MTDTYISRQPARADLTAECLALSTVQATYDHVPNAFDGIESPVVTVNSLSTDPQLVGSAHSQDDFFLITLWVLRVAKGKDLDYAEAAENELDEASKQVHNMIEDYRKLDVFRQSEVDYEMLGDNQYRTERIFVRQTASGS